MKNASFVGNQCLITRILGLVKYKNYRRLYLFDASRCLHNVVVVGVAVENQVDFVPLHEVVVKQEELFLVDDLSRSILQNLFHLPTYLPTYKHTCLADGESVP